MHDEPVSRREFSKRVSALGALAVLAPLAGAMEGCASLPTAESIEKSAVSGANRQRPELSSAEMAGWRDIANLARLAPTPHNTQPFRIRPLDATTAEIVALSERFLPEEDHGNLFVTSAFGLFAACTERAAQTVGAQVTVTPVASVDVAGLHRATTPTVLGMAKIIGPVPPVADPKLLEIRRTSRIPYQDRLVDPEIWTSLSQIAAAHGHRFLQYDDPTVVEATLQLNTDAVIDNLQLGRERREIEHWYRVGPTPRFGDGLWEIPLNQSALEIRTAFSAPKFFQLPIIRPLAERRYLRTQRGTRHIAICGGPFKEWPDLVQAGRALFGIWIEMARHGVYVQPMGSMLTNPVYAAEIARRFGMDDCWMVMRAGYSDVPPRAPRLESILI